MKDNEKRPAPPPPHGDPHHDDHGHNHKKKKKHRGGVIILILVIVIIILAALIWFFRDGLGFGKGNDNDSGNSGSSNSISDSSNSSDFVSDVTEIRIEQNDIYFGSDKCADTNDLKDKLTSAGSGKKYKLEHKTAIEETYNEVKNVLIELRDALDLEIDFNE